MNISGRQKISKNSARRLNTYLCVLAEILFGKGALFGADVIGNITTLVGSIGGENGLIGLVALFILVALLKK